MKTSPTIKQILALIILFFLTSALQAQKKEKSVFNKNRSKVEISDLELRLRLSDYFIRFAEDVEETADKIYFGTSESEIKRAALMWKIYGISAMNKAINMPDPIASFYNAWPLSKQLIYFFEEGKGEEVFRSKSEIALELCREYESKLDSISIDMTSLENHNSVEIGVAEWARNHPIENFYFTRESTMAIFAEWLGEENMGFGKNVSTITEEVIELSNRLNLYVDLIPRQARWQIDYAIMNYLQDSMISTNISTMVSSADRIANVVEMTPDIIEYNREATMRDIDEQREKSLRLLIDERKAIVNELRDERIEVISKIVNERMVVLEEIKSERSIILEEVKGIYDKTVKQAGAEAERLIDVVFWRLTLISIIFGVAILLAVILYKKL